MKKNRLGRVIGIFMIIFSIVLFGGYILVSVEFPLKWSSIKETYSEMDSSLNFKKIDSNSPVDSRNNGKNILIYGKTEFLLNKTTDEEYNVSVNSILLSRTTEKYIEKNEIKEWENFGETIYRNGVLKLGPYEYNYSDIVFDDEIDYYYSKKHEVIYPKRLDNFSGAKVPDGWSIQNSYITNSKDINNPQINDIRIHYEYYDTNEIIPPYYLLIGVQKENKIDLHDCNLAYFVSLEEAKTYLNNISKARFILFALLLSILVVPIIGLLLLIFGIRLNTNIFTDMKKSTLLLLSIIGGLLINCIIIFI